jgi:hypothetical protein
LEDNERMSTREGLEGEAKEHLGLRSQSRMFKNHCLPRTKDQDRRNMKTSSYHIERKIKL